MLKYFIILVLSTFLLFSCGNKNKEKVVVEPDINELGKNLYE